MPSAYAESRSTVAPSTHAKMKSPVPSARLEARAIIGDRWVYFEWVGKVCQEASCEQLSLV